MKVKLDIRALTVNKAWQGRRFKTDDYKNFEEIVLAILPKKAIIVGRVEIIYKFYLIHHATTDYDNLIKPLQDILVTKGYIEDDRFIYKASQIKIPAEEDKIEIEIKKYAD